MFCLSWIFESARVVVICELASCGCAQCMITWLVYLPFFLFFTWDWAYQQLVNLQITTTLADSNNQVRKKLYHRYIMNFRRLAALILSSVNWELSRPSKLQCSHTKQMRRVKNPGTIESTVYKSTISAMVAHPTGNPRVRSSIRRRASRGRLTNQESPTDEL